MLASGKPVLVTADPGTELFEVLTGTAILTPAGDSAAMAEEIGRLLDDGGHKALGNSRGLAAIFERETCLKQFQSHLDRAGLA
jgi:colanic acid biosynthesis glycosyl transferase WcaI